MYEVINKPAEIKKYQEIFEHIIKDDKKLCKGMTVTFNPGREVRDVYWSSLYWTTSRLFTNNQNKELRYKNWFGIIKKEPDKELELVVEINFSLCRGNTSGKFIKDDGKIFVVHTGSIGRDKKDSIANFWKHYKGKKFENEKLALIGELPDKKDLSKEKIKVFQGRLSNFIEEVQRIKTLNNGNGDDQKKYKNKTSNNKVVKKILTNKPNPNNGKPNIHIDKQTIINKAFKLILDSLVSFIKNTLMEYGKNDLWKEYIYKKLSDNAKNNLPKEGSFDKLIKKLDISSCLHTIINNWDNVFKNVLKRRHRDCAYSLLTIRNDDAHFDLESMTPDDEDLELALLLIIKLMRPINPDIADEILKIKNSL
jgi:hypothetical protein